MVGEMKYSTVSEVADSWELVRRHDNYEEVAGVLLYKKLFELSPDTREIFAFGKDVSFTEEDFKQERVLRHARFFIGMLDQSLALLGPDIELLTDILFELGKRHRRYGIKSHQFIPMGQALIWTVQEMLGDDFTEDMRQAWTEVWQALSLDMVRSMNSL